MAIRNKRTRPRARMIALYMLNKEAFVTARMFEFYSGLDSLEAQVEALRCEGYKITTHIMLPKKGEGRLEYRLDPIDKWMLDEEAYRDFI